MRCTGQCFLPTYAPNPRWADRGQGFPGVEHCRCIRRGIPRHPFRGRPQPRINQQAGLLELTRATRQAFPDCSPSLAHSTHGNTARRLKW